MRLLRFFRHYIRELFVGTYVWISITNIQLIKIKKNNLKQKIEKKIHIINVISVIKIQFLGPSGKLILTLFIKPKFVFRSPTNSPELVIFCTIINPSDFVVKLKFSSEKFWFCVFISKWEPSGILSLRLIEFPLLIINLFLNIWLHLF